MPQNKTAKILTVAGARPQFIKAAAVSRAIRASAHLHEVMVHTGQHYDPDMSDLFFEELDIAAPAHRLAVHGGGHGDMTGRMLQALEPLVEQERPDYVLVYGDTNSTLAGALVAAKLRVPVAHVEAGLRSYNRRMPEEINRVVTDHLSRLLFCPTVAAVANLATEGISEGVFNVGDVMFDAARHAAAKARAHSRILDKLGLVRGSYAVATVHRAENTDNPARLAAVIAWLKDRATRHPVIFPVHPRTRQAIARAELDLSGITTCPPIGYLDMVRLLDGGFAVYTDSGGLQKEAYFYRKPCVTLRDETEWVETIENGWNRLWQGPDYRPRREIADYGEGNAAEIIVDRLTDVIGNSAVQ